MRIFTGALWISFWQHAAEIAASRGVLIICLLIGFSFARGLLNRVVDGAVGRLMAREQAAGLPEERAIRLRTLQTLFKSLGGYVLTFILVIMLLDAVGANVAGILTTAGIGGIAIGFGAQRLVRDIISGFFIIVEDQFGVGDYITLGGPAGTIAGAGAVGVIESIGMRTTRLRDDTGRLWTIANGDIMAVVNHTRAPVETSIEIGLAAGADLAKAEQVIRDAGESLKSEGLPGLVSVPASAGISSWDNLRTSVRITFIADPRAVSRLNLRVREALHARLRAAEIPLA